MVSLFRHIYMEPSNKLITAVAIPPLHLAGRRNSKPKVTRSITEDVDAVIKLTSEPEAAIHNGDMSQVPPLSAADASCRDAA